MTRKHWSATFSGGWTVLMDDAMWAHAETWCLLMDRYCRAIENPKASAASISTLGSEVRRAADACGATPAARARLHWWPLEQASAKDRARHLASVSTAPAESYTYDELMARREAMGP